MSVFKLDSICTCRGCTILCLNDRCFISVGFTHSPGPIPNNVSDELAIVIVADHMQCFGLHFGLCNTCR